MKKILLLSLVIFFVFVSNAQLIQKNQKLIGGSLGFDIGSTTDTSATSPETQTNNFSIFLSPSYGKAIKNNFVLGYSLTLGFNSSRSKDYLDFHRSNGFQTGASVFMEKFHSLGKNFFLSTQLNLGGSYSSSKSKVSQGSYQFTSTTTGYSAGLGFTPGLIYAFNKKLLMQFGLTNFIALGYHQDETGTKGSNVPTTNSKHNQFYLSSRLNYAQTLSNISFGFRYIL